ncbi:MAG: hypothetical protein JWR09_2469 [Mucilaginibacter sp.]|nr:hypothetical protein [Mucilaginibacter sp.]
MEKIIAFNGIKVFVTWEERLKLGTDVYIHTGDPGLAINIIQLFLDEMGKQHLWYEQGWPGSDDYQEITLTEASDEDWEGWSREEVLSKINEKSKMKPQR